MGILDNVNAVVAGVKKVREVAQKIHDANLQSAIADLVLSVADLKTEMADLRDEHLKLRAQVEDLKKKADIRTKVVYRAGLYYLTEPVQGYPEGPFCPVCMDSEGLLITVRVRTSKFGRSWNCGHCRKHAAK